MISKLKYIKLVTYMYSYTGKHIYSEYSMIKFASSSEDLIHLSVSESLRVFLKKIFKIKDITSSVAVFATIPVIP